MIIESRVLGKIEIDDEKIITFPEGVVGFPDTKRYVLLHPDEESPFGLLQAVDDADLAFMVTEPRGFFPEYHVKYPREELKVISYKRNDPLVTLVILTMAKDISEITANLKAPLVFNLRTRLGKQVILYEKEYPTKEKLIKGKAA